tara:strand:+ start:48 stop:533 length:486 start_codon:yes stop_codon:yes gene_type:complete
MVNRQLFSFDLNDPFFKHSVGFDRLFNQLDVINNAHHLESTYPPYNIIKTGDETFSIELAVAGFTKEEIDVEVKQNVITVRGEKKETEEKEAFVHKGIGTRKFQRAFTLADYVEVIEGDIVNGILVLKFERKVPEAMKPRKIELGLKEQSPKEKLAELLTE